jgi:hypothetical protein
MPTRKLSLFALLLIVPVALNAQGRRGGGGGGGGGGGTPSSDDCGTASSDAGRDRGFKTGGGATANKMINCMKESPSLSKDLEKANPIETLLDAKKDLKLTSDEEKELKNINKQLKDDTKPYFKTIDSVAREMKKTGDYAPTSGQMVIGRTLTRESADSIGARYRAAADAGVAKLSEDKRQPATDLLQKEMESQMASRRGGRPPV